MVTAILIVTLLTLAMKMTIYHEWYAATTTTEYQEMYGKNTYNSKMYKLALSFYIIATLMALIALISVLI